MKPVFSSKAENYFDQKQMLGVFVEKGYSVRLALYSLLKKQTRSHILKKVIIPYIDKNIPQIDTLLEEISKAVMEDWQEHQTLNRNHTAWDSPEKLQRQWQIYLKELTKGLKSHKLPAYLIADILVAVEEYQKI